MAEPKVESRDLVRRYIADVSQLRAAGDPIWETLQACCTWSALLDVAMLMLARGQADGAKSCLVEARELIGELEECVKAIEERCA